MRDVRYGRTWRRFELVKELKKHGLTRPRGYVLFDVPFCRKYENASATTHRKRFYCGTERDKDACPCGDVSADLSGTRVLGGFERAEGPASVKPARVAFLAAFT